jgi:hypothetical protein
MMSLAKPLVASSVALAALLLASNAFAAGTLEQRRACRQDAFRLCREAIPNVKRITTCMEHNIRRLSPACRAQFK